MEEFLELSFAGLALGARYALVALGFVIIHRATGVINFAQGGLVVLGAYLAFQATQRWGLPFVIAVLFALAATALVGVLIERLVLRRLVGQPVFAIVMITIGILILIEQMIPTVWGAESQNLGDPWGVETLGVGGIALSVADLWTIVLTAAALAAFFLFFRLSRYGLAMRAAAFDQEAALAQGISVRRVVALSWAIAGIVGALAGITLAAGATGVDPTISFIALAAFPAMILGGLDSPGGAVVGGLVIGVTQTLTAGYQPDIAPWLGSNFYVVMPYVVMVLVLMVRPYGLFGTPEVRRV
jgi:branched-chain amino acid transport system permease protein